MLCIDKNGNRLKEEPSRIKGRRRDFDNDDALRDIILSVQLQLRDHHLAQVEENVIDIVLEKMAQTMRKPVHQLTEHVAIEVERKKLGTK